MKGHRIRKAILTLILIGAVTPASRAQSPSGMHPEFSLLDKEGQNVVRSGLPLSTATTCGACHDTEYIISHTIHTPALMNAQSSLIEIPAGFSRAAAPDSGEGEMNCLLCHLANPATTKWHAALSSGSTEWAATATLAKTGLVRDTGDRWEWISEAFGSRELPRVDAVKIVEPVISHCAQCHGLAGASLVEPVTLTGLGLGSRGTLTTGEVISPQRISHSGLNLLGKQSLARVFDVHAERLLDCTDCHHSLNNPAYSRTVGGTPPRGLLFDSRRVPIGVYLKQPDHNLAGQISSGSVGEGSDLSCSKCHDPEPTHRWLPYAQRHYDRLSCSVCHTPALYAPAVAVVDWTIPGDDGTPHFEWRGIPFDPLTDPAEMIDGFEPILFLRREADGRKRLAPFNPVLTWRWVTGQEGRPIPMAALRSARGAIAADSQADKESLLEAIREYLSTQGYDAPRMAGEIQPWSINHSTIGKGWALRDCRVCHRSDSWLTRNIVLDDSPPADTIPVLAGAAGTELFGEVRIDRDGRVVYEGSSKDTGFFIIGHDRVRIANLFGILAVLGALAGIAVHAGLRWWAARGREKSPAEETAAVYMYTAYERFWHWLQAAAIGILLITGLEIHAPSFRLVGFATAVQIHNIISFLVVANALFAAFYHLASGQIRQYLPEPGGFFTQAAAQLRYYMKGIFAGEPHPFAKRPHRKLNPLQQITYLAILNVLLPVQMSTGLLIWGTQRWPGVEDALGGLTIVVPIHALGAWLFAAFLLVHVYLTTTGPRPTSYLRAMLVGWEKSESHH
jgi:thiosulfate reductase cytochrome b subunit